MMGVQAVCYFCAVFSVAIPLTQRIPRATLSKNDAEKRLKYP